MSIKHYFYTLILLLLLASCSRRNSYSISVGYEPEINYITHIYTLANLGFSDNEYSKKYSSAVSSSDIEFLKSNSASLQFGQGMTPALTKAFFFDLANNKFSDKKELTRVLRDSILPRVDSSHVVLSQKIADIFIRNYDTYFTSVYPHVTADLSSRAKYLNSRLSGNNIIKNWEKITGYRWKNGDYRFLLFFAGQNGPSFNNLNVNTNTLYYLMDDGYTLAMLSHEFGIFLMMDRCFEKLDGKMNSTIWMAFESLATWFNSRIEGKKSTEYYSFGEADPDAFFSIYDDLLAKGVTDPADLLKAAVKIYDDKKSNP